MKYEYNGSALIKEFCKYIASIYLFKYFNAYYMSGPVESTRNSTEKYIISKTIKYSNLFSGPVYVIKIKLPYDPTIPLLAT